MMRLFALAIVAVYVVLPGRPADGQALLRGARTAVGGDALQRVRSLQVDFTREGAGMDFRLPDAFRLRTGYVDHILQGASFRQSRTLPDDVRAEAHARTEFTFAANAIKYLLAVPAVLDIRVVPSPPRTVEGLGPVDVVTFEGQRGFKFDLFLHRATHMPLGSEAMLPMEGGVLHNVAARFEDYREVGGVKFPFVTKSMQQGYPHTTTVSAIRINPDLKGVFGGD